MKLSDLQAKMKELLTAMRAIADKEKPEAEDKEKLVALRTEFDELATTAEDMKRATVAAEVAKREERHEEETSDTARWDAFHKAMREGVPALNDDERKLVAMRDERLMEIEPEDAIRLPGDALCYFREAGVPEAKRAALGTVTSDIADIVPPKEMAPTFYMPLPVNEFFARAVKVPAINGVTIPMPLQTAADPFAGVTITKAGGEAEDKVVTEVLDTKEDIVTSEYNAFQIVSNLALRRVPEYAEMIRRFFVGALAFEVNADIIAAIIADVGVQTLARAVAVQVAWADIVGLETLIPYAWRNPVAYALSAGALGYMKVQVGTESPWYAGSAGAAPYTTLNGHEYFVDNLSALGTAGDVIFGNIGSVHVGVGEDIVFTRTDEGLTLKKANSTGFFVHAHLGIGIPVPEALAYLDDAAA